jgi:primary-amine oxidase
MDAVTSPPGPDNPIGNAWTNQRTVYSSESQAQAQIDPLHGRYWKIENPNKVSELGDPVAYKLMPGDNVAPMFSDECRFAQRGGFTRNHVWVTAYDPEQRFAAGDYPYQHSGGDGLPRWTAEDRDLENTDVVLWYVFGAHHIARPEDWPVMPVSTIGFMLKPVGFFDGNPSLDMPAPTHCHG